MRDICGRFGRSQECSPSVTTASELIPFLTFRLAENIARLDRIRSRASPALAVAILWNGYLMISRKTRDMAQLNRPAFP